MPKSLRALIQMRKEIVVRNSPNGKHWEVAIRYENGSWTEHSQAGVHRRIMLILGLAY
jgi:hypothetical protein